MSRRLQLLLATALLAVSALAIYNLDSQSTGGASPASTLALGWASLPPVPLALPAGDPISGTAPKDDREFVLVNLWASNCGPCRKEMPQLDELAAGDLVHVVGIARDVDPNRSIEFLKRHEVAFPSWWDGDGDFSSAVQERIPLRGLPTTLLLDDGELVAVHTGALKQPSMVEDFVRGIDTD